MGYSFHGIFTNATGESVMEKAKARWPFCRIKPIEHPHKGLGIAGDNEYDDFIKTHEENQRLQNELLSFSREFPEAVFVFLWVDCHGGDCIYEGFSCKNGKTTLDNRGTDSERFSRQFERNKLRELLDTIDIQLDSFAMFGPLERGYFD